MCGFVTTCAYIICLFRHYSYKVILTTVRLLKISDDGKLIQVFFFPVFDNMKSRCRIIKVIERLKISNLNSIHAERQLQGVCVTLLY